MESGLAKETNKTGYKKSSATAFLWKHVSGLDWGLLPRGILPPPPLRHTHHGVEVSGGGEGEGKRGATFATGAVAPPPVYKRQGFLGQSS